MRGGGAEDVCASNHVLTNSKVIVNKCHSYFEARHKDYEEGLVRVNSSNWLRDRGVSKDDMRRDCRLVDGLLGGGGLDEHNADTEYYLDVGLKSLRNNVVEFEGVISNIEVIESGMSYNPDTTIAILLRDDDKFPEDAYFHTELEHTITNIKAKTVVSNNDAGPIYQTHFNGNIEQIGHFYVNNGNILPIDNVYDSSTNFGQNVSISWIETIGNKNRNQYTSSKSKIDELFKFTKNSNNDLTSVMLQDMVLEIPVQYKLAPVIIFPTRIMNNSGDKIIKLTEGNIISNGIGDRKLISNNTYKLHSISDIDNTLYNTITYNSIENFTNNPDLTTLYEFTICPYIELKIQKDEVILGGIDSGMNDIDLIDGKNNFIFVLSATTKDGNISFSIVPHCCIDIDDVTINGMEVYVIKIGQQFELESDFFNFYQTHYNDSNLGLNIFQKTGDPSIPQLSNNYYKISTDINSYKLTGNFDNKTIDLNTLSSINRKLGELFTDDINPLVGSKDKNDKAIRGAPIRKVITLGDRKKQKPVELYIECETFFHKPKRKTLAKCIKQIGDKSYLCVLTSGAFILLWRLQNNNIQDPLTYTEVDLKDYLIDTGGNVEEIYELFVFPELIEADKYLIVFMHKFIVVCEVTEIAEGLEVRTKWNDLSVWPTGYSYIPKNDPWGGYGPFFNHNLLASAVKAFKIPKTTVPGGGDVNIIFSYNKNNEPICSNPPSCVSAIARYPGLRYDPDKEAQVPLFNLEYLQFEDPAKVKRVDDGVADGSRFGPGCGCECQPADQTLYTGIQAQEGGIACYKIKPDSLELEYKFDTRQKCKEWDGENRETHTEDYGWGLKSPLYTKKAPTSHYMDACDNFAKITAHSESSKTGTNKTTDITQWLADSNYYMYHLGSVQILHVTYNEIVYMHYVNFRNTYRTEKFADHYTAQLDCKDAQIVILENINTMPYNKFLFNSITSDNCNDRFAPLIDTDASTRYTDKYNSKIPRNWMQDREYGGVEYRLWEVRSVSEGGRGSRSRFGLIEIDEAIAVSMSNGTPNHYSISGHDDPHIINPPTVTTQKIPASTSDWRSWKDMKSEIDRRTIDHYFMRGYYKRKRFYNKLYKGDSDIYNIIGYGSGVYYTIALTTMGASAINLHLMVKDASCCPRATEQNIINEASYYEAKINDYEPFDVFTQIDKYIFVMLCNGKFMTISKVMGVIVEDEHIIEPNDRISAHTCINYDEMVDIPGGITFTEGGVGVTVDEINKQTQNPEFYWDVNIIKRTNLGALEVSNLPSYTFHEMDNQICIYTSKTQENFINLHELKGTKKQRQHTFDGDSWEHERKVFTELKERPIGVSNTVKAPIHSLRYREGIILGKGDIIKASLVNNSDGIDSILIDPSINILDKVTSILITNKGSNYNENTIIIVEGVSNIESIIKPDVYDGKIYSINVIEQGSGFTQTPSLEINNKGNGIDFEFEIIMNEQLIPTIFQQKNSNGEFNDNIISVTIKYGLYQSDTKFVYKPIEVVDFEEGIDLTSLWNGTYHSSQIVLDPEFNITYPLIGIELKIEDVSDQQNSFSVTFDNDLTSVLGCSKENTYKLDGDVGSNIVLREKDISTVPFFKNQVITSSIINDPNYHIINNLQIKVSDVYEDKSCQDADINIVCKIFALSYTDLNEEAIDLETIYTIKIASSLGDIQLYFNYHKLKHGGHYTYPAVTQSTGSEKEYSIQFTQQFIDDYDVPAMGNIIEVFNTQNCTFLGVDICEQTCEFDNLNVIEHDKTLSLYVDSPIELLNKRFTKEYIDGVIKSKGSNTVVDEFQSGSTIIVFRTDDKVKLSNILDEELKKLDNIDLALFMSSGFRVPITQYNAFIIYEDDIQDESSLITYFTKKKNRKLLLIYSIFMIISIILYWTFFKRKSFLKYIDLALIILFIVTIYIIHVNYIKKL